MEDSGRDSMDVTIGDEQQRALMDMESTADSSATNVSDLDEDTAGQAEMCHEQLDLTFLFDPGTIDRRKKSKQL